MRKTLAALLALSALTAVAPPAGAAGFDVEGHRGTRGLRPENTLAAFGKALQLGVTTLELDTGVTADGVVVVSHERRLSPLECQDTGPAFPGDPMYPYIGHTIHELTYAEIQTIDCGTRHPADPSTDPFVGTQESVPGTHMPKLSQVFALADRYGATNVQFNIETKIDPTVPTDTLDPQAFAEKVLGVVKAAHKGRQSLLQSFDWRTLVIARQLMPGLRTVALAQPSTVQEGQDGTSPWTAGIDVDAAPYDGDVAKAAKAIGASVLSPTYGTGTWGTSGFAWYLTPAMIASAHQRGLKVVPWTVDDVTAIDAVLDLGVDGIISDYPDRLRAALAARGIALPAPIASPFDVEAHRGGRTYRPENTLASYAYGLAHGADTLEMDIGITKDGAVVMSHNRQVNPVHCHDTAPATPGDPLYPYAGKNIRDLTLAQIETLDCGHTDPAFPQQVPQPGEHMPTLQQVFDLVNSSGNTTVRFNIETKIDPLYDDTVPYDVMTRKLVEVIQANHMQSRAMIQSFDWRTIMLSKQLDPSIETVGLIWQYAGSDCDELVDECSLEAVMGDRTVESPWLGGLDWWKTKNVAKLAVAAHADVVSPNWQVVDPNLGHVVSTDDYLKEDPAMFHGPKVAGLHRAGLRVVPYTIDDAATMQRVIDLGVDGIISDDPDLLVLVAKRNGLD